MTRNHRSGRPTITDVATKAGVSPATVSRVMNGRFVGDRSVADRVRTAAAALQYTPSPLARSLVLGQTKTVAFVVPDLGNPAFQDLLHRLTKAASKDGYRVLIADSGESPQEEELLAMETRRRCDSVVLCAPRMPADVLERLAPRLHPLVLVNRPAPNPAVPSLSVDYRAGIMVLARHLYALGHRRLVYIAGPAMSISNTERLRGLDEFAAGAPGVVIHRVAGGSSSAYGHAATDAVLASGATAALAFNDLVAVGLLTGLAERGRRVPEDLSVTGFDDIPLARYISPSLTTVTVPWQEIGVQAWARMHALICGEDGGEAAIFQPELIARASSGPVPVR
ncbi:LacI family DNA-binding transcriptional regulator [Peterkaempfera sp. SMS 1(5)a]|uniref:LacI family DNA-binding transcriptional regulator n=1 Tax=Peterkaempfera podocarpi TaxID=3232308 RepID=UPI00367069E0